MTAMNPLAAEMLEASANGYAAAACAALQRHRARSNNGDIMQSPAPEWRAYFQQRVLELAAAVRVREPALFVRRVQWLRRAMSSRGADTSDLGLALTSLHDALSVEFPANLLSVALAPVEAAIAELQREDEPETSALDPKVPSDRLALEYLEACLSGNPEQAAGLVLEGLGQFSAEQIFLDVLIPAEKEIGHLWHTGDITIAEEHLVTETTRHLISVISHQCRISTHRRHSVLAASVTGNSHDIALRLATELFRLSGYRAIFLGASLPAEQLARAVNMFSIDLVVLGAMLETHLNDAARAIEVLKRSAPGTRVMVGGLVFDSVPDLWRRIGADGYAPSLRDVVATGTQLLASPLPAEH
jgi:MerR family transcriptional regulator, light-induced transcriptional regulator